MSLSCLEGISAKWLKLFRSFDPQLQQLKTILDKVLLEQSFCPNFNDIFTFAKFSLHGSKVVILGMDPYPNKNDAHGLSFSTKSNKCPASLNRIFATLQVPEHLDLSYWSVQGIILLNTALTVKTGSPGSHMKCWSDWMDKLIVSLSIEYPDLIWCLWGSHAQSKETHIKKGTVLKWCHPVAPVEPSFSKCDHFTQISAKYPDLIWDFSLVETHFFTDCSAPNNQSKLCKASWGVLCTKGLFKNRSWAEELQTVKVNYKGEFIEARPTNIRAEGMAIVQALTLAKLVPFAKVSIFTDSLFWIQMLTEHIPNWIADNTPFTNKKNSDLVSNIWNVYKNTHAQLKFVNCWHDREEPTDPQDHYIWKGNKDVEAIAAAILK